jgi:PAS domain-containing protein
MKKDYDSNLDVLRRKAEEILKQKSAKENIEYTEADVSKLIHELDVYHLELEMQNIELTQAKNEAENTAALYSELYDSAPTGFFTLTSKGEIVGLNLNGATMLGADRHRLIGCMFGFFVSDDTKPVFNKFLDDIFATKAHTTCEISLIVQANLPVAIHLSGIPDSSGTQCHINAVDISELKSTAALNEILLNSLPHPAMYIRRDDRTIIAANKIALEMGIKVGGYCWREFMHSEHLSAENKEIANKFPGEIPEDFGIKCSFCQADECFTEAAEQRNPDLKAFEKIWDTYWIKATDNVFLHYAVNITDGKLAEEAQQKQAKHLQVLNSYFVDREIKMIELKKEINQLLIQAGGEAKYETHE